MRKEKKRLSKRQIRRLAGLTAFVVSLGLAVFGYFVVIPLFTPLFGYAWILLALLVGAADLFYAFNRKFEDEEIRAQGSRTPGRMEMAEAFNDLERRRKSGEIDEEAYKALRKELLKRL